MNEKVTKLARQTVALVSLTVLIGLPPSHCRNELISVYDGFSSLCCFALPVGARAASRGDDIKT